MVGKTLLLLVLVHTATSLYIGMFIPYQMTPETVESPFLSDVMLRILQRYDLVAVHGLRNSDAMRSLFEKLQRQSSLYEMIIAFPIDKPGHLFPDVNAFIYKKNMMTLSEPIRDQPSGALYTKVKLLSVGYEFVFTLLYNAAENAVEEAELIPSLYERSIATTGIEDALIVGSFGAGLPFMTRLEYDSLTVTTNDTFQWYVDYDDDTILYHGFHTAAQRYAEVYQAKQSVMGFIGVKDVNNRLLKERLNILNITDYYGLSYTDAINMTFFYPIEIEMKEPTPTDHQEER